MSGVPSELLGLRFDPWAVRGRGHVESWFFKANEPSGRRAIWIKTTIFASASSVDVPAIAEAWAIAFDRERGHVATKTAVPFGRAHFARGALDVEVDGATLTRDRTEGALASGARAIAWDLAIGEGRAAPILHLPSRALYAESAPGSKALSPVADALASGHVHVSRGVLAPRETWDVSSWPCMVGHNWGSAHPALYAWTHCNAWDVPDLVLEAISLRMRVGPLLSPMVTAAFVRFEGRRWDLNAIRDLRRNRGVMSLRRWELEAGAKGDARSGDGGISLTGEVAAETDDLVGLHYANPRGPMSYCLNTKLGRARLELAFPSGRKVAATSRAAALELVTHVSDHGVKMIL